MAGSAWRGVCVCVYCREEALPFKVVFIWPIFIFNGHFINAGSRDPSTKLTKYISFQDFPRVSVNSS